MPTVRENNKPSDVNVEEFRGQLLDWYDRHRRVLPWRALSGQTPNPYHVWLSEIMLQQTTVGAVGPYFTKFLDKWPDVQALAAADQDELMEAWAGLGYYARARNLHKCAKEVVRLYGGKFPNTKEELQNLPGIGDYTSAAITAIAFNKPATVVDGNVERVMARIFAVKQPLPKSKPKLKELATLFFNGYANRPGDLAQAFMDLGAGVCIAKTPRCSLCPVSNHCHALAEDIAADLPRKEKKKKKPQKYGHIYWITDGNGSVLLHRRPDKGLLGGTLALPTSQWLADSKDLSRPSFIEAVKCESYKKAHIDHSFTHFDLKLTLRRAENYTATVPEGYFWTPREEIEIQSFPTVFKKAVAIFLK